eukprot:TRINITY_DN12433_c0_g1_i1.p1 TRINITY_DN12433_c0_g1~~TRINITY_DN12433_c0_g1_i1.p1  ORF type:complete len:169 (-),score=4.49 TRINITY_DN12433_c0_g1_i1:55-561(-)
MGESLGESTRVTEDVAVLTEDLITNTSLPQDFPRKLLQPLRAQFPLPVATSCLIMNLQVRLVLTKIHQLYDNILQSDTRDQIIVKRVAVICEKCCVTFLQSLLVSQTLLEDPLYASSRRIRPVSYTHLTLPTILLVQISVVAVSLKKKNYLVCPPPASSFASQICSTQ